MNNWVEIRKKPCSIGKCSRAFLIDKNKIRLDSRKTYIVRVIEAENFFNKKGWDFD